MKKDIKKRFFLAAMVASLALLWGGVTSCSNGNDNDDETIKQEEETIEIVNNKDMSGRFTSISEWIQVAESTDFADLTNEDTVKIEVIYSDWKWVADNSPYATLDGKETWCTWSADGSNEGGQINDWDEVTEAKFATIMGDANITALKANGLFMQTNNDSCTVTVKAIKATPNDANDGSGDDTTTGTDGSGTTTDNGNDTTGGNNNSESGNGSGDAGNGDNTQTPGGSDDNEGTESGTTTTLPTWVGINGGFKSDTWEYNALTETSTKGIWTATISGVTVQYPNFQIKAGDEEKIYAGSATEWTKVELGGSAVTLVESTENLGTTCWEDNSGTTSVNLLVTVDFTKDAPTIKIATTE